MIDADGTISASTGRTTSRRCRASWRSSTSGPAISAIRCSTRPSAAIGVYICYERHFPEGWRALGLAGAKIVFNPSATSRGLSEYLWKLEQPAAAVANEYFVGTINRVGVEPLGDNEFYGQSYFVDPRGQLMGEAASDTEDAVIVRDLDLGVIDDVRRTWAVLPGPPAGHLRPAGPP